MGSTASSLAQPPPSEGLSVREVDVSHFPEVRLVLLKVGTPPSVVDFHLRENGRLLPRFELVPLDTTRSAAAIVLAIDTSGSMRGRGALDQAKAAARDFVGAKLATDRIAIVAFSDQPRVVTPFTGDTAQLTQGIDSLAAEGRTALWDAVVRASEELSAQQETQKFLIVLSDVAADSFDNNSTATAATARDAATKAGALVFTIGLPSGAVNDSEFRALATATGGIHSTTTDPAEIKGIFSRIQGSIRTQYELTYRSSATTPGLDLVVTAGGAQTEVHADVPPPTTAAPLPSSAGDGSGGGVPGWIIVTALLACGAGGALLTRARRRGRHRGRGPTRR